MYNLAVNHVHGLVDYSVLFCVHMRGGIGYAVWGRQHSTCAVLLVAAVTDM